MTAHPEKYLEYLDKEMTIMGVVSAFSVALAALVTNHFFAASGDSPYANIMAIQPAEFCVLLGGAAALIAAVYFYLQRSLLAWYYGQLALEASLSPPNVKAEEFLAELDGWNTWLYYQAGCTILGSSFACYASAVLVWLIPGWPREQMIQWSVLGVLIFGLVLVFVVLLVRWYVLSSYWDASDAYEAWRDDHEEHIEKPALFRFIVSGCLNFFLPPTQTEPNRLEKKKLLRKKRARRLKRVT